jgi:hypothetical protein
VSQKRVSGEREYINKFTSPEIMPKRKARLATSFDSGISAVHQSARALQKLNVVEMLF